MPRMSATPRIDVSIEHKHAKPDEPGGKDHPNTCPSCGSHYRDEELERNLRVCEQCGHHYPVRAPERIAQLADEGSFLEDDADLRSADPLHFFDLRPYTERLAEAEMATGPGRRDRDRRGVDRDAAVPSGGDGLLVPGRLDGQRRRREVRPRV